MNTNLSNFFDNPTLLSAIVVFAIILGNVLSVYFQNRHNKKIREVSKDASGQTVSAIDNLSNKIQIFLDKEVNNVNLQNAENIITASLRKSEAKIKEEVRRIFFYNNRSEPHRQQIIKKALAAVTLTAYTNDTNALSKLFYKEKTISEYLINVKKEEFFSGLLQLVFNKSSNDNTDLQDCLYYIESSFNSYITNAKSYYSNL